MKRATPKFVTVSIFTTITIIFWIFYVIYEVLISAPPTVVDPELLNPINPQLDTGVLEELSQKEFFEEGEEIPFSIAPETSPTPTADEDTDEEVLEPESET